MATQKQIFSKMKNGLGSANQTVPGLVQTLQNYAGELENATGGGGGGSTVSFTQTATSGGECGTITIDDVATKIYAPTPAAPAASAVSYVNTTSGLTADDVQEAIDEIVTNTGDLDDLTTTAKTSLVNAINEIEAAVSGNDEVSYDATGITYSAALDALYAACDLTKITANSKIVIDNQIVLQADNIVGPYYEFSRSSGNATSIVNAIIIFMSSGSTYGNSAVDNTPSFTHTDLSSTTVTGTVNFKLIY